ncbi:amidohydrolase family protein [Paraburkholderia oxyphila]|uniref:amidohydrolase family protein n=1 Tax=Paraburkholderia oxyphila TaxID=614212 RepID=UPI0005BC91B7|nr:amidohydrolase family protein [Paraburkholderia oxyphila]
MKFATRIADSHLHFYDHKQNRHTFLDEVDRGYEAFVGNYDALPRRYLLDDYLSETSGYNVEAVVWHEFLSSEPFEEAAWAQRAANARGIRHALVAFVDFLDPELERKLDQYSTLPNLTSVREHLVWDERNPLKRFAKRPDLLADPAWRKQLPLLRKHDFKCGLEVFAHQLPDLTRVIQNHPDIGFTIALMGWPLDLSKEGFDCWRRDLAALSTCDNICVDISALECIFGMQWSVAEAAPWVSAAIDTFGVSRCMFGSHMPIARLSTGFADLYERYAQLVTAYSENEVDEMFFGVASRWFNPT